MFDKVHIYYAWEMGSDTSDGYKRHEEIYNPVTKKVTIWDCEYDYGALEIFGENAYIVLKSIIEEQAKKKKIKVEWESEGVPKEGEFSNFCESFILNGGMEKYGNREEEKDVPNCNYNYDLIEELQDRANELGYNEIAKLISKFF